MLGVSMRLKLCLVLMVFLGFVIQAKAQEYPPEGMLIQAVDADRIVVLNHLNIVDKFKDVTSFYDDQEAHVEQTLMIADSLAGYI